MLNNQDLVLMLNILTSDRLALNGKEALPVAALQQKIQQILQKAQADAQKQVASEEEPTPDSEDK